MGILYPPVIDSFRDSRNGHQPATYFYSWAVESENHLTAYRRRQVFGSSIELNDAAFGYAGTTSLHRFRFRSGYGATVLTFVIVMGLDQQNVAADPHVDIDVKIAGGATTTYTAVAAYGADSSGSANDDAPDEWVMSIANTVIASATTYEVTIKAIDYARILSVLAYEQADLTVSEATPYYNAMAPAAGVPIYDSHRSRLLTGMSNMWRQNAGTLWHWGRKDGSARTRSSATLINLIDDATTGTPTAAHRGVYLTNTNRYRTSKTAVGYELGVYASIAAGSGTVRLTNTAGTDVITATVNSATPQWFTASGNLTNADTFHALRYNGDGANTINVYQVSLLEYV